MTDKFTATESINGKVQTLGPFFTEDIAMQAKRYLLSLKHLDLKARQKKEREALNAEAKVNRENIKQAKKERWDYVLELRAEAKAEKEKARQEGLKIKNELATEKAKVKKEKEDREKVSEAKRKAFREANGISA